MKTFTRVFPRQLFPFFRAFHSCVHVFTQNFSYEESKKKVEKYVAFWFPLFFVRRCSIIKYYDFLPWLSEILLFFFQSRGIVYSCLQYSLVYLMMKNLRVSKRIQKSLIHNSVIKIGGIEVNWKWVPLYIKDNKHNT